MAHLVLQGVENFSLLYLKLIHFVLCNIGVYTGPSDTKHNTYIYSMLSLPSYRGSSS